MAQTTQPAPAGAPRQADVPVKAVVLYSSGVGYFEHFGTVRGDGSTELRFKTDQINDILKSLVLQDLDGGKVSTITYPSQDPLAKTLRSFQVDITANPSLADLLNQLRGAKVQITTSGGEKLEGVILGVEKKKIPVSTGNDKDKTVIDVPVLNYVAGSAIRNVQLDQVSGIQLDDPKLQDELNRALSALAQARDQDKKPVQIHFAGQGERRVRLGYVVETPIWKTSYRLILPSGGAQDKPKLQGWAIVENQTDNDWNNVQLSLISGRPISFIQDLYQPLYIARPVVQPELYASLRPQTYEGGIEAAKEAQAFGVPAQRMRAARDQMKQAAAAPMAAGRGGGGAGQNLVGGASAAEAEELSAMDVTSSVASIASAAKVGELFQYTVGNVSLPRQRSAMLPIITDDIEVEKLSIYNQNVLPKNPLNGARVKNTTDKHLLQGPITVLEGSTYSGDARIDNLPPGQERLLSYGIDLQMTVDATKNRSDAAIQTARIVKGVLILTRKNQFTQEYLADNKSDHDKTLIVEHPIRQGWKLIDTDKPIETTDTLYRFKGTVTPGKASKLVVREETISNEQIAILPADFGALAVYARTGEIPKDVRDALIRAIQLKQAVVDTERQIAERDQRIATITAEQNRIRENMRTVAQNSEYYKRLLSKLNDQETQIEQLQTDREKLVQQREKQQKDLEDYLSGLNVG
jgi:hypothetical protein